MSEYELCINLWYCFDKETGYVNAIAGRGYYLQGDDEQKTNTLKGLSCADFFCVEWQPVPENYKVVITSPTEQEMFSGFFHVSDIDIHGFSLFEEVLCKIENINQQYLPIKNAVTLQVPSEPLYVMTAIENSGENNIKAIIS
jgi:hypothetical protein